MMRPPFSTLGDATMPAAARADLVGFVRGLERAVIDEAQHVPGPRSPSRPASTPTRGRGASC